MKPVTRQTVSLSIGILAGVCLIEVCWARVWTDVQGRKVDATLVSHDQSEVIVRLKNGKNATIPLGRLSEEDQQFLSDGGTEPPANDSPEDPNGAGKPGGSVGSEDETSLNWNEPWPTNVPFKENPEIEVIREDADAKQFVYESTNYRFTCDVRLSKSVVSTFADMFETTRLYCRALPLAISGGVKHDGKYDILLFAEKDDYIKAGGPPTSAGVFIGGKNVVMVPLGSLGVKKVGSGYMRDRDKSDGTLVHELTHQLTPYEYFKSGARGWFTEGLAEYLTSTPYRSGRFKVKGNLDDIIAYATGYGKKDTRGRALGENIHAPRLKDFMLMSYGNFTGSKANFNYGFGLVLTTYYMVMDGEGDAARLKEFLKELRRSGRKEDSTTAIEKLLDGRSFEQMEDDISKAWKRKGVKISFGS